AGLSEDGLFAVVMAARLEDEFIILEGVARERASALLDVILGVVVALAKSEELHQFAREVLVGMGLVVLVVVEELQHRRIADDAVDQVRETAGGVGAEELVLREHVPGI